MNVFKQHAQRIAEQTIKVPDAMVGVMGGPSKAEATVFLAGTRRVVERAPNDFRVVCATCGGGGVNRYRERSLAAKAAVRDSGKRCHVCGAG